jgi:hypothetical protein
MECKSEHMLSKTFAATFVPRIPAASHSLGTYIYDLHVADSILYSLYRLPPLLPFSVVTMRKRWFFIGKTCSSRAARTDSAALVPHPPAAPSSTRYPTKVKRREYFQYYYLQ